MSNFFRRYQKFFFLVIAAMVTLSFVFAGTFGAMTEVQSERADCVVGKSIDGSDLRLLEIAALSRFIASDREDIASGGTPNLLNDGVIRQDLISGGIAAVLVRDCFDSLKDDLADKVQKIKAYRAYEHPGAPFLSAKSVWQKMSPGINEQWTALQGTTPLDLKSFSLLTRLYQLQSSLPTEWLRRILMMQEQQYKQWLQPDPKLRQADLALFGFHSLNDWFGKNFIDLMAEFIHNAAITAEEKGYTVSLEEAKGDMQRIFAETTQKLQEANWPSLFSYQDQLRMLGMVEEEAVAAWQKVLLFRRYFQDMSNAIFMDRLSYAEFAAVAKEKATVDLYQWSDALKMTSAVDLVGLQTYVNAVAHKPADPLSLPTDFLSVSEVEAKAPAFIATVYKAKVFAVDKREAALKATLKDVWRFETNSETWERLRKEFAFLTSSKTVEERFALLEKLTPTQRSALDMFARRLLVDQHPEWVKAALDSAEGKETQLIMSAGEIHLPHVKDAARLGSLFQKIPTSPETALLELNQFESGDAVFRFEQIEKVAEPKIKTFQEAIADGSLARVVDKNLASSFSKLRSKLPAGKEFAEVKEEVANLVIGDLKAAVAKEGTNHGDQNNSLAAKRLAILSNRARKDLMQHANEAKWLKQDGDSPLQAQFKLERQERQITRMTQDNGAATEFFLSALEQWTPVHITPDNKVFFSYLKAKEPFSESVLDKIALGKQRIGEDLQCLLAEKILLRMHQSKAVILPLQTE